MQEQIAATLAILDAVDRTALGDDGDRPVSFELPNGMIFDMSAFDYVRDWAAPQFAFHHVAAYAVLRHMGVPLGKADYVDRKSTRRTPVTNAPLVCRLLLEKKKNIKNTN